MGIVYGAAIIVTVTAPMWGYGAGPVWVGSGGREKQDYEYLGYEGFVEFKEPKFAAPSGLESATVKTKSFAQPQPNNMPHEVESLTNIRAFFSLNISELAKVFGVSRPAMYAWLNGTAQPTKPKQEKIRLLGKAADDGFKRFGRPLGSLSSLIGDDLVATLSQSDGRNKKIDKYLNKLLAAKNAKPKSLDEEIAELGLVRMGDLL